MANSLFIDVVARFAQFQDSLNKIERETTQFTSKISGAFGKLNGVLAGFGAGIGSGEIFRQMIQAANEAEKASNRLTATIRATGSAAGVTKAEIDDLADSLAKTTQFDDESIRNAASELLIFRNIQGETFEETLKLSADVAAALGTNIPEAAAKLGRSLEDPDTAFGLLRRQGIILTEQQKDLIKSLGEAGDVAGQQRLLLDRLKQAYGGLAEEMNTGINKSTTSLKKAWDELMESLGKSGPGQATSTTLSGIARYLDDIKTVIDSGDWVDKLATILTLGLGGTAAGVRAKRERQGPTLAEAIESDDAFMGATAGAAMQRAQQVADAAYSAEKKRQEELKKLREQAAKEAAAAIDRYAGELRTLESQIRKLQGEESTLLDIQEKLASDKGFNLIPQKQRDQIRSQLEERARLIDRLRDEKKAVEENTRSWVAYIDAINDEYEAQLRADAELVKSPKQLEDIANAIKLTLDPLHEFTGRWNDVDDAFNRGLLSDTEARLAKLPGHIRDLVQPTENVFQQIQRLWEANRLTNEEMEAAFKRATEQITRTTPAVDRMKDAARDLGLTFQSAFEQAVIEGRKFGDVLKGLGQDIARIFLRKTITEPLAAAGTGLLENLFKGGLSGLFGGSSGYSTAQGGMQTFQLERSYATGTDYVPRTGAYLLHQGEAVIPASENMRGNGFSFTQINNIDSRTDAATVGGHMMAAKVQAVAAMEDLNRRTTRRR